MKWLLSTRRFFRVADSASFGWNYTKTLVQTAFLWAVFLFILPSFVADLDRTHLNFPSLGESKLLAVVVFVIFGSLGLWAGVIMAKDGHGTPLPLDTASELAIAGPYEYVRNPMAIAACVQAVAASFWLDSGLVLLYGVGAAFVWNYVIRPPEQLDLEERFGDPYRRYYAEVRCWVPRRSRFQIE